MHLTVTSPFTLQMGEEVQDLKKGDKIYDADEIKAVLAGDNASHVVKTADLMNGQVPQKTDLTKLN